jgi:bacterioferritin (cytochrome b1)
MSVDDEKRRHGRNRSALSAVDLPRTAKQSEPGGSDEDLLTKLLKMEEGHEDWAEAQRDQIAQMGQENYLANQVEGAAG